MTAIIADLWQWIAIIGAGVLALVVARWDARKDAKRETALEAAERYAKTRKAMDDAEIVGADPDAARRWLRERGE